MGDDIKPYLSGWGSSEEDIIAVIKAYTTEEAARLILAWKDECVDDAHYETAAGDDL